jgi:hypothetical protein
MSEVPACLQHAITSYRDTHWVPGFFSTCLDRLQEQGFSLIREPDAAIPEIRRNAAGFVIHYISLALDDHRISAQEMDNILSLKHIYGLDEGDLLVLQPPAIAELLEWEMSQILADEQVNEAEAIHQSDLQRALGLGYDQYLQLTREAIRPLVERLIEQARLFPLQHGYVLRRLQGLRTVLRIDTSTMKVTWPD